MDAPSRYVVEVPAGASRADRPWVEKSNVFTVYADEERPVAQEPEPEFTLWDILGPMSLIGIVCWLRFPEAFRYEAMMLTSLAWIGGVTHSGYRIKSAWRRWWGSSFVDVITGADPSIRLGRPRKNYPHFTVKIAEDEIEMTKWEYKYVDTELPPDTFELNQLGEEGWEVVCFSPKIEANQTHAVALLKRPLGKT